MPEEIQDKTIRVALVEDHPMFRERLAQLIERESDMSVCGEADDRQGALTMIHKQGPDIVIVDIGLRQSSGIELVKDLQEEGTRTPVLVLSMHDEARYAECALRAGARGYITKSEASADVMRALRVVLSGGVYLNEQMTSKIIERMTGQVLDDEDEMVINALAGRELQVFRLIGQGKNTHDIASQLDICESTVAGLRARIKEKIGVKDIAELYHRATEWMKAHRRTEM